MNLAKRYKKELAILAIGVGCLYAKKKHPSNVRRITTTISPSPDEGVIFPYSLIHRLVAKGAGAGGAIMTVKENVDDEYDAEFLVKFLGMVERK